MARVTLLATSDTTAGLSSASSNGHKGVNVATITPSNANLASSRQKNNAHQDEGDTDPFVKVEWFSKKIM